MMPANTPHDQLLTSPILRQVVYTVQDDREVRSLVQEGLEMLDGFLLRQVQPKFILELLLNVAMLNVGNVGIDHQADEIHYEARRFAENREGREAEVPEAGVVRRLRATHGVHHLTAELYRRREWLGISSKNIPEVDMEEMAVRS